MPRTMLPCSDDCLDALHRHVPGLRDAPDEEKLSRVAQHFSSFKDGLRKLCDLDPSSNDSTNATSDDDADESSDLPDSDASLLSRLARKLSASSRRAAAAETRLSEMSRTRLSAVPIDPEMLRERADLTLGRIELAAARGELTPAIAGKLKARVQATGPHGQPNVYLLSRNEELGARPIDFFLDLLSGEKLSPVGSELSGAQTLSRLLPADHPTPPEDSHAEMPFKTMAARHNSRVSSQ